MEGAQYESQGRLNALLLARSAAPAVGAIVPDMRRKQMNELSNESNETVLKPKFRRRERIKQLAGAIEAIPVAYVGSPQQTEFVAMCERHELAQQCCAAFRVIDRDQP
jgi:hypothetical protein